MMTKHIDLVFNFRELQIYSLRRCQKQAFRVINVGREGFVANFHPEAAHDGDDANFGVADAETRT